MIQNKHRLLFVIRKSLLILAIGFLIIFFTKDSWFYKVMPFVPLIPYLIVHGVTYLLLVLFLHFKIASKNPFIRVPITVAYFVVIPFILNVLLNFYHDPAYWEKLNNSFRMTDYATFTVVIFLFGIYKSFLLGDWVIGVLAIEINQWGQTRLILSPS